MHYNEDWIAERAYELAEEEYAKDYYELSDSTQLELWVKAEAEYTDREADRIDAAYDAWLENQLMDGIS